MILTLSEKTCALMRSVHASGWHVPIVVHRSPKGRARIRRRAQVRKGSGLKTPLIWTAILRIGQALPFHYPTQTVTAVTTTVNRLLSCFKYFYSPSNAHVLCTVTVAGWLAGWLDSPHPPLGMGQSGSLGFPKIWLCGPRNSSPPPLWISTPLFGIIGQG